VPFSGVPDIPIALRELAAYERLTDRGERSWKILMVKILGINGTM
jgi:hypothetical protein